MSILIPIKIKWFITSLEDEKIYLIGNIIPEKEIKKYD